MPLTNQKLPFKHESLSHIDKHWTQYKLFIFYMIHLSYSFVGSWKHHDVIVTWKRELQKSNSTQKCCAGNTEGSPRSEKRRRKGRELFHFLDSSADTQPPLITPQIKQSISQLFVQSLMQINGGGKKVRLTINPKKINHILSCQPILLSSQNKHHNKNPSPIHEIYAYVYMKRKIWVYCSNKVTL